MGHLRYKWNFNSLQENLHIVAQWLDIRFRKFVKCILKPYLGTEDYGERGQKYWQAL